MNQGKREVNVVTLLQKTGLESHESAVDPEQLRDVILGLYFSAHWYAQRMPYVEGLPYGHENENN